MFPIYVDWWAKHPDVKNRVPKLQEHAFAVRYQLPSGRAVRLRGKYDSVDLIGEGKGVGVYLQENKTKSDINELQIKRQLTYDLQTMIYLVSLDTEQKRLDDSTVKAQLSYRKGTHRHFYPIAGVRYNVIRRPRQYQGKKETQRQFLDRLQGIIQDSPGEFFMRWKCEVSAEDLVRFRRECLDPILEQLCDWWEYVTKGSASHTPLAPCHWRHPFGVWNVLDEGGSSDLDEYLATGSEIGLRRVTNLFPELAPGTDQP
jgi:hypothetical protein